MPAPDILQAQPFNIVLIEPEIPPNTGSIARLCGATDTVLHLVRPLGFRTDDRYLKRAGLDYWPFVSIVYWENMEDFFSHQQIDQLHFFTTKVNRPYTDCRYRPGDFMIFGKETKGLPEDVLAMFRQRCFTIPMSNPNIRSLNLAMSVGIVLYEALRQQKQDEDGRPMAGS